MIDTYRPGRNRCLDWEETHVEGKNKVENIADRRIVPLFLASQAEGEHQ
ncbi:MAG: hypothetical protein ACJ0Q1_07800 [Luminiphilus sp.]